MVLKSVCEIHACAKFSSFIMLWSRELFGRWRHNWLAKGNAHRANNALIMVQRQGSMRTISDSWCRASLWWTMHGFGTELIRNLAIWLANSRDFHLFIYKVYWYNLSTFVPIFTSFGIENPSRHSGRPRKLLALISLFKLFFFISWPPCFNTGHR